MALGLSSVMAHGLAEVLSGADVQDRCRAGLGEQQAQAEPGQVGGAEPLHRLEGRRVGGEQGRDAGDRQPHEDLIARDHAERGRQAAGDAALARRRDEREVPGPGIIRNTMTATTKAG
jgi:hypothetical protein